MSLTFDIYIFNISDAVVTNNNLTLCT